MLLSAAKYILFCVVLYWLQPDPADIYVYTYFTHIHNFVALIFLLKGVKLNYDQGF